MSVFVLHELDNCGGEGWDGGVPVCSSTTKEGILNFLSLNYIFSDDTPEEWQKKLSEEDAKMLDQYQPSNYIDVRKQEFMDDLRTHDTASFKIQYGYSRLQIHNVPFVSDE